MNRNLYNSHKGIVDLDDDMKEHLRLCFLRVKDADENVEGYNRNQRLQTQQTIDYKQLKRIKNFFDNFKGNQHDAPFVLNGGFKMKNFVENALRRMRESEKLFKRVRSDGGMENQYIDTHTKDGIDVRPSQEHSRTVDKYNYKVVESLKRINELISKI